ncbi:hypothetical protein Nepgr_019029 [Nepenthes gracilis]|uniref:Uncharacterized protein n=1 Tax=Nepenthes gracilis TaxID=150966 RepID=A0AAD3XU06_NEPGR|nr:hypothetical protein Nepgr_019029 [Nepenthes gracilis]
MRCKKHLRDVSSSVGVCASCLRERLLALIAAQAQEQRTQAAVLEDRRKSDPQPPPLVFPRSVSPYVSRRKSDANADWYAHNHHCRWDYLQNRSVGFDQRFFRTPQVGPAECGKKQSKFRVISNLFRSRSQKMGNSGPGLEPRVSRQSCEASSSSWIPGFIRRGRRRKGSSLFSVDEASSTVGPKHSRRDRGMAPHVEEEDWEGSPSPGEYAVPEWKRTPWPRQTTTATPKQSPRRSNVSSLAFSLSPYVPAGCQNRYWCVPDAGYSGQVLPHLSTAATFGANRSRKLADFGRLNHNC